MATLAGVSGPTILGMKMRRLRRRVMQRQHVGAVGVAWAFKRERQRADLAAMAAGQVSQEQLAWFSGGKTRELRIVGAPY